jgi:hypothetical protein
MAKINQKTIDSKLKFINNVIEKIKRGTATTSEIDRACDTISWLWKWKVIDREESGRLADAISDAMEGIE